MIGCETALWLAQQGKKTTIAEIGADLLTAGIPVQHMNRLMLLDLLAFHKVKVLPHTTIAAVTGDGALVTDGDSRGKNLQADTIVLAVGLKPEQGLYRELRGQVPNLFSIGDSRIAQNIMNAVWDAYEVARMI